MPTTISEQVTAVEDQVLDLIHQSHDTALAAVRDIANTVTSTLPKVPEWVESFAGSLPKFPEWVQSYVPSMPEQISLPDIDNVVDFYEKIWDSQRQFNQKVIDALTPIASSALSATRETAKAVRGATATAATTEHAPKHAAKHAAAAASAAVEASEETAKVAVNGSTGPAASRRIRALKSEA